MRQSRVRLPETIKLLALRRPMNFERSGMLIPILDDLETDDQSRFNSIQQKVLAGVTKSGQLATAAANLVFQALRDELTKRAEKIFSEIQRVLAGTYIEDCDNLGQALKTQWLSRMEASAKVASSQLLVTSEQIRSQIGAPPRMPSETALSEHVAKLKLKWFAEIELFCTQLHDGQSPRLFLRAGEAFAGNRAARAVFAAAQQLLDIIDTHFGPQVFDMLEVTAATVWIRLISNRADASTRLAYGFFNQQFDSRAQFRLCDPASLKLHDRFIVVDGRRALHLGHSIKDLGGRDSLIDSTELEPHRQRFEQLWLAAQPVT